MRRRWSFNLDGWRIIALWAVGEDRFFSRLRYAELTLSEVGRVVRIAWAEGALYFRVPGWRVASDSLSDVYTTAFCAFLRSACA